MAASLSAVRPSLVASALMCVLPIWFLVAQRGEFKEQ